MTGHPEAVLARELGQCYAAIALVTNAYLATAMLLAIFAFYESHSRRAGVRRVVGNRT